MISKCFSSQARILDFICSGTERCFLRSVPCFNTTEIGSVVNDSVELCVVSPQRTELIKQSSVPESVNHTYCIATSPSGKDRRFLALCPLDPYHHSFIFPSSVISGVSRILHSECTSHSSSPNFSPTRHLRMLPPPVIPECFCRGSRVFVTPRQIYHFQPHAPQTGS